MRKEYARSCAAISRSLKSSRRGSVAEPGWEILAPHPLSVVCFRYAPPGLDEAALEALNASIMHAVNATGEVFISHTKIDGRYALRLAIGNLRTQRSDVEHAWEILKREARSSIP